MKLAFLYAGQGSQKTGMGKDLYDTYPESRFAFEVQPRGLDLKALCFEADGTTLSRTSITQPCMGAFAAAVTRVLENNDIRPHMAAGLSLGEYGALHAAGVLDAESLIDLLAFRGSVMEQVAQDIDCGMTAIFGLEEEAILAAIEKIGGKAWCCNFNCPGQIVIGGPAAAVTAAAGECIKAGAKRAIPLAVGGPFHTPMMDPAALLLAKRLETESLHTPAIPIAYNLTGGAMVQGNTLKDMLPRQMTSPVRFESCIRSLLAWGAEGFVEIGPGKVLTGFVRKIDPAARVWSVESAETLALAMAQIKEESQS